MESGGCTSSLMFGVQWDLILKHLEMNGTSQEELKNDSTSWGNYFSSLYNITNLNAKYNLLSSETYMYEGYKSAPYNKMEEDNVRLTTGASETFNKMGIFDLAGNFEEFTLEFCSLGSNQVYVTRGSAMNDSLYAAYRSKNIGEMSNGVSRVVIF